MWKGREEDVEVIKTEMIKSVLYFIVCLVGWLVGCFLNHPSDRRNQLRSCEVRRSDIYVQTVQSDSFIPSLLINCTLHWTFSGHDVCWK